MYQNIGKLTTFEKWLYATFVASFVVLIEPAPFDIMVCAAVASILAHGRGEKTHKINMLLSFVLVYAFWRFVTIVWADNPLSGIRFFSITTYLSLMSVGLASYISKEGTRAIDIIFKGMSGGVILTMVGFILGKMGLFHLNDIVLMYQGTRVRGFFKDANVLGPALIPVILYTFDHLTRPISQKKKTSHAVVLVMSLILLLLAFSRGAWATAAGAGVVYLLARLLVGDLRLKAAHMVAIIMAIFLGGSALYVVAEKGGYMDLLEQRSGLQSYDLQRFAVHEILFYEVGEDGWGHGPGQTRDFLEKYYAFEEANDAHNTYLRNGFEYGYVGICLYLLIVLSGLGVMFRGMWRYPSYTGYLAIFAASVLATSVSAFTVDTLHWRHFWVMMALGVGLVSHLNGLRHTS